MACDLAAIRARLDAATPGPWTFFANKPGQSADNWGDWSVDTVGPDDAILRHNPQRQRSEDDEKDISDVIACDFRDRRDAEFVAHAREDVAALLEECERLRWLCDRLFDPAEARDRLQTDGAYLDAETIADIQRMIDVSEGVSR